MRRTNTNKSLNDGVKALVTGPSGIGKTSLARTTGDLPRTVVISAEAGTKSLADEDIDVWEVSSVADMTEAYKLLSDPNSEDSKKYDWVIIDSLSEIGEFTLAEEKLKNADGRQYWQNYATTTTGIVKAFRDLKGKNVIFTAKLSKIQDDPGRIMYGPDMPGKVGNRLTYLFDLAMHMDLVDLGAGKGFHRALICQPDGSHEAKSRHKLNMYEKPDLGLLLQKINGTLTTEAAPAAAEQEVQEAQ